jgi:hypothetical protein
MTFMFFGTATMGIPVRLPTTSCRLIPPPLGLVLATMVILCAEITAEDASAIPNDEAADAAREAMIAFTVDSRNEASMLARKGAKGAKAVVRPVTAELEAAILSTRDVFTASPEGVMVNVAEKPNGKVLTAKKNCRARSVPVAATVIAPDVNVTVTVGSEKVSGMNVPPVAIALAI